MRTNSERNEWNFEVKTAPCQGDGPSTYLSIAQKRKQLSSPNFVCPFLVNLTYPAKKRFRGPYMSVMNVDARLSDLGKKQGYAGIVPRVQF